MMGINKRKGNVPNFHGMGGLKGWDGLILGVTWLFLAHQVGSYHHDAIPKSHEQPSVGAKCFFVFPNPLQSAPGSGGFGGGQECNITIKTP